MNILSNPWVILAAVLFLAASHSIAFYKGDSNGYDRKELEIEKANQAAENQSVGFVEEAKNESKIIYKYIRENDATCDSYSDLIGRLPEPRGNSRQ